MRPFLLGTVIFKDWIYKINIRYIIIKCFTNESRYNKIRNSKQS